MEKLFRIGVSVTKGDKKGEIIRLMSSGSQASATTSQEAIDKMEDFSILVKAIDGKFDAYGCIFCQDEASGKIVKAIPLI